MQHGISHVRLRLPVRSAKVTVWGENFGVKATSVVTHERRGRSRAFLVPTCRLPLVGRWGVYIVFTGHAWSPTYWGASHLVELACRCGIELLEGRCPSLADYVRGPPATRAGTPAAAG